MLVGPFWTSAPRPEPESTIEDGFQDFTFKVPPVKLNAFVLAAPPEPMTPVPCVTSNKPPDRLTVPTDEPIGEPITRSPPVGEFKPTFNWPPLTFKVPFPPIK